MIKKLWHLGALLAVLSLAQSSSGALRVIRAQNMTVAPGATNRILIVLESLGDESALGFSIAYDPNLLTLVRGVAGIDATNAGADFNLDLRQTSDGFLGIAVVLDIFSGTTFSAGTNVIAEIYFAATAEVPSTSTFVTFTNQPIVPEVSNTDAQAVPVSFVGATVLIRCDYALSTNAAAFPVAGGSSSMGLTATCAWAITNTNSWITITSATNGSGAATVNFDVLANPDFIARTGVITIAEQTFTVTQAGAVRCVDGLAPTNAATSSAPTTNSFNVTASGGCAWTVSNTNSWITILSGGGTGNGTVTYTLEANPSLTARSGSLSIEYKTFTVTQQAVTCTYALSATNDTHSAVAYTNTFTVAVSSPCSWSVDNTNSWISILAGANGSGPGEVTYSVAPNLSTLDRSGALVIGGEIFSVTQQGISCSYSVSPPDRTHGSGSASNYFTVNAATGCPWSVVNTNPWIAIVGEGGGSGTNTVGYTVDANPLPVERVGILSVQGVTLVITQQPGCSFIFSPGSLVHNSGASNGLVNVTVGSTCAWTATTTNNWITITSGANGTGNGSFSYSVPENLGAASRTGWVLVAGQTIPVTQAGYTTNTTGRVDYVLPGPGGTNQFYRAVLP
jgi:hypothetical protein